ncbi:MAG: hypothetical protein WBD37_12410, partial [Anderseniella sp.]
MKQFHTDRIIMAMKKKLIPRTLSASLIAASLVASGFASSPARAIEASPTYKRNAEKGFETFMDNLWPEAQARGISRRVFDASRKRISLQWDIPDLAPPKLNGEQ